MTSDQAIGGFFELELPPERPWLRSDAVLLNSGRACLEYLIRAHGIRRILLPRFTCDVIMEPVEKLGVACDFYRIGWDLSIDRLPDLEDDQYILYTNYFGCRDRYCTGLAERYGRKLILDCSQALFFEPAGDAHLFYSPRKFVGAPDGGCLYTDASLGPLEPGVSTSRYAHLVGRIDEGPEAAYEQFKLNDGSLSGEPLRAMSRSTRRLLASIDYEHVKARRRANFERLHARLGARNRFAIPGVPDGPMVYPFLPEGSGLREKLISEQIYVATYWPNVLRWCGEGEVETMLTEGLIPIPIDQRYGPAEMDRILKVVEAG